MELMYEIMQLLLLKPGSRNCSALLFLAICNTIVCLLGVLVGSPFNVVLRLFVNFSKNLYIFLISRLTLSDKGKGIVFNGVKGLKSYTISKGENLVAKCVARL